MGKKSKDPLAEWAGPQIDRTGIESVLDSYFEGLNNEATPATEVAQRSSSVTAPAVAANESQKIHKSISQNKSITSEIETLTGSVTGSINLPHVQSVSERLDATHTTSESVIYSVMYRETHSKGIRTRRFSIPELMKLSGIRSKNTVRRALAGLKEKLSIKEIEPAQATFPALYEIGKIREIFAKRSAAGIEIDDQKKVFHRNQPLTRSKIDPLTRSKIDPLLKDHDLNKEEEPAAPAVEKNREDNKPAAPVTEIFEDLLNRQLTAAERERVISEMSELLREWATAKSIHATEPIREVTYFLNGLRQALIPKRAAKDIEPDKLRRWVIRLLKEKWPTSRERAQTDIGEAAEYVKQRLANHRINYSLQVSILSATIGEWYQGVFDNKK